MPPDLETVDLIGVELLATGGPVHGGGSPPEGDYWSTADLEAIASANRDLAAELKPAAKLGHAKRQALLADSGLTDGEMPAIGWADGASFRVSEDGTRLLADIRKVPKKLSALIEAGAWRTRSVELGRVTSQATSKTYDWAVTGFAWLGAQLPAVRTLDDVFALYADDLKVEHRRVVSYASPIAVAWDPEDSFYALRDDIDDALNPGPADQMMVDSPPRFRVVDLNLAGDRALVARGWEDDCDAWVVAFTVNSDGTVALAPSTDWVTVEKAWVVTAERKLADRVKGFSGGSSDTPPRMPTYTADARRKFADATGLETDNVTDEMLAAAGIPTETPVPPPPADTDGARALAAVEQTNRELAETRETLRLERRRTFVDGLLSTGKIEPGQRATWEKSYDSNPIVAAELAATLKPDPNLLRELGSDSEGKPSTDEEREAEERNYAADASRRLGLDEKEII